jgi:hypothetical protein
MANIPGWIHRGEETANYLTRLSGAIASLLGFLFLQFPCIHGQSLLDVDRGKHQARPPLRRLYQHPLPDLRLLHALHTHRDAGSCSENLVCRGPLNFSEDHQIDGFNKFTFLAFIALARVWF